MKEVLCIRGGQGDSEKYQEKTSLTIYKAEGITLAESSHRGQDQTEPKEDQLHRQFYLPS